MELVGDMFAVKVNELREEYDNFLSCMELLNSRDVAAMGEEINRLENEEQLKIQSLRRVSKEARLPATSRLASLQLSFLKGINEILEKETKNHAKNDDTVSEKERMTELMALYTEYAIDAANLLTKHAYLSALKTTVLDKEE